MPPYLTLNTISPRIFAAIEALVGSALRFSRLSEKSNFPTVLLKFATIKNGSV
jgi:hypothetical protein